MFSKSRSGVRVQIQDQAGIIRCEATIINVRTKNNWWYYPACGRGKCKKGVTWNDGKLWHSCSKPVNYAKPRFRLEVDVKDESAQTVIVTWDETASELTKSSAKALLDGLDEVEDDAPVLPHALTNLFRARGVTEVSDDDTPEGSNTVSRTPMKQLVRGPQMHTPSKTSEQKKKRRYIEQDSEGRVVNLGIGVVLRSMFCVRILWTKV
ncbi:nucleic acid-binding, OB-fold protein [Tanacetum coccineum]